LARIADLGGRTPSDFPAVSLTQDEIDGFDTDSGGLLVDILPLTPLQEGLYFHSTFDDSSRSSYVEQQIIEIGKKIKQLRQEMKLSLRDLAKSSGTSASTIHKIESNSVVPSIAVLIKIAQALKKNVGYFIGEEDNGDSIVHIRPGDREVFFVKESKLKVENIASTVSDCQLEGTLLRIKKGGTSGEIPLTHTGEEIKFCLKGRMQYAIEGQEFILAPGDCLHFKSGLPHSWKNVGKGDAEVLSVCTPPPFRSFFNKKKV